MAPSSPPSSRVYVSEIQALFRDIKDLYHKRKMSSRVYNDIYFASCFYDTMKQDLEELYRISLNFSSIKYQIFEQDFILNRVKELNNFGYKLKGYLTEGKKILEIVSEFHSQLLGGTGQQKMQNMSILTAGTTFAEQMSKATEVRYEIETEVYSWRKQIDFDLNKQQVGIRTKDLTYRNYFAPERPNGENLSKFFHKLNKVVGKQKKKDEHIKLNTSDNELLLSVFIDFKESGEDTGGLVTRYFNLELTKHKKLKDMYQRLLPNKRLPECDFKKIGPFQLKTIKEVEVFSFAIQHRPKLNEKCHILLKLNNEEFFLTSGRITKVTVEDTERKKMGLPEAAKYFCYMFPCKNDKPVNREAFDCFKYYGGFLYFDEDMENIIYALALNDLEGRFDKNSHKKVMYFSYPFYVSPSTYDARNITFKSCTFHARKNTNVERFAWVNPGELGYRNLGSFIFENNDGDFFVFNFVDETSGKYIFACKKDTSLRLRWELALYHSQRRK